jgi:hypothetical protein
MPRLAPALFVALIALAGCKREPTFDERFGKAEAQIRTKAAELDSQLAERERQAREAAAIPSAPASAIPRR